MRACVIRATVALAVAGMAVSAAPPDAPLVGEDVVFAEAGGIVAVEAEHYFKQTDDGIRKWHLTSGLHTPAVEPDGDPPHVGASGGAYMEVLPDNRRTHADKLTPGENFSNEAGKMAILHYKVHFTTPGKYYVWARIYSTGGEDNGLHVGIDGTWPESGQRMQWVDKHQWAWGSKQRTEKVHVGEPYLLYLDVREPGEHTISFSMREDGIEFDKWLMTTDREYTPKGAGPGEKLKSGTVPPPFPDVKPGPPPIPAGPALTMMAVDFPLEGSAFYKNKEWLAIHPDKNMHAVATAPFPFATGRYDVTLWSVGENDGASLFRVTVGGRPVGSHRCPPSDETYEEAPKYTYTWKSVACTAGEPVTVQAVIGSDDGLEFSRGRWSRLEFRPAGKPPGAK